MRKTLLILLAIASFSACKKEKTDDEQIQDYLQEHNLTAQKHSSGLYYIIENEGNENKPNVQNNVVVYYKGYYTDNEVFDQTKGDPIDFVLGNLIYGWQLAIPMIGEGGKMQIFLPSDLGYNDGDVRIFDIELVDVY